MTGLLAVWTDCASGQEADFEAWYTREHLPERVAIPGFLVGRRFQAIAAAPAYLATYEVANIGVLASADYRDRLNTPTPATIQIMRNAFRRTTRAVCQRRVLYGATRGAVIVTIATEEPDLGETLEAFARTQPDAIHAETWLSVSATEPYAPSQEGDLRGADGSIGVCLALEFLRDRDALAAADVARAALPGWAVGSYRLLCELRKDIGQ